MRVLSTIRKLEWDHRGFVESSGEPSNKDQMPLINHLMSQLCRGPNLRSLDGTVKGL